MRGGQYGALNLNQDLQTGLWNNENTAEQEAVSDYKPNHRIEEAIAIHSAIVLTAILLTFYLQEIHPHLDNEMRLLYNTIGYYSDSVRVMRQLNEPGLAR